jgi:hypothetical protein
VDGRTGGQACHPEGLRERCHPERMRGIAPTDVHTRISKGRLIKRSLTTFGMTITPMEAVDLTYRTDLRELNELNFARFDAKLEQRLAELRSELQTELRTGLHGLRADLLRWMFGFWATTLLTLVGLMIALRGP